MMQECSLEGCDRKAGSGNLKCWLHAKDPDAPVERKIRRKERIIGEFSDQVDMTDELKAGIVNG